MGKICAYFLGIKLGIRLPDYKIGNCLALINIAKELSEIFQSSYTSPTMCENSASLSTLDIDSFVSFNHSFFFFKILLEYS